MLAMADFEFLTLLAFAGFLAIAFYYEVYAPEFSARARQERADRDAQRAVEAAASSAEFWAKHAAVMEIRANEQPDEAEEAEFQRLWAVETQRERERLYNEKYPQE